jgi:hypothetical protein
VAKSSFPKKHLRPIYLPSHSFKTQNKANEFHVDNIKRGTNPSTPHPSLEKFVFSHVSSKSFDDSAITTGYYCTAGVTKYFQGGNRAALPHLDFYSPWRLVITHTLRSFVAHLSGQPVYPQTEGARQTDIRSPCLVKVGRIGLGRELVG